MGGVSMSNTFYNSVYLDAELCVGCINCIKRCPTEAIRVRNNKATINKKYCIDCGVCIRTCKQHAKIARHDLFTDICNYKYSIALPAPSLYGQFNNLNDVNIILTGLKKMGFDDVFEVSSAAEVVSQISRKYMKEHKDKTPIISTACPVISRLISIKFPNLIPYLLPVITPADLAAKIAKEIAVKKTGLKKEEIGVFFISPCPAKYTAKNHPIGIEKSEIDRVIPIKDIYPLLSSKYMAEATKNLEDLSTSGQIGIRWGQIGGEALGTKTDNYMSVDGIERVLKVLEDLEDKKLTDLEFIELNACDSGCVGGVFTVENPFMAKAKLERLLKKTAKLNNNKLEDYVLVLEESDVYWNKEVVYEPVFNLGENLKDSFTKMNRVNELCRIFPGLDCGSCGAPTCSAFAEDVVRGYAEEKDCVHVLRELYEVIVYDEED